MTEASLKAYCSICKKYSRVIGETELITYYPPQKEQTLTKALVLDCGHYQLV